MTRIMIDIKLMNIHIYKSLPKLISIYKLSSLNKN